MTGILAVQGAFAEHGKCLEKLDEKYKYIRKREDFTDGIQRLIFPGGESTTQRKLIRELGLYEPIRESILNNMPVFGTCAGLILLSENVSNDTPFFGTLPVSVCRNAYGRQLGSFFSTGNIGNISDYPMRFIRAPYVEKALAEDVQILNITDGKITAVKYKNQLGTAFHPELTDDLRIHEFFLNLK